MGSNLDLDIFGPRVRIQVSGPLGPLWDPWGPWGPMGTHGAHGAHGAHGMIVDGRPPTDLYLFCI